LSFSPISSSGRTAIGPKNMLDFEHRCSPQGEREQVATVATASLLPLGRRTG
jgi:hypothetical protein